MNASAQKLAFASISTVAESVRRKELSPVELVRASLDRIEAFDSKLNSFYTLFRDDVLAAARDAEAEIARGHYRGRCMGFRSGSRTSTSAAPPPAAQNRSRIT
jgi:Asp-tRNA(Asn)/Glu-tRNA(Gln) amidotransferase A subunit family amidase